MQTSLARFLRGVFDSTVVVPGTMLGWAPSIDSGVDGSVAVQRKVPTIQTASRVSDAELNSAHGDSIQLVLQAGLFGSRRLPRQVSEGHTLHEAIASSSHPAPRLVLNSGGVSSHACVSFCLSVSASTSARAPAALGVMPTIALAGDAVECSVSHHCMMVVIRCWRWRSLRAAT